MSHVSPPPSSPCPLPRSQWALWESVVRDPRPHGGQQLCWSPRLPRAWRKEGGVRRHSSQHLTCSLELAGVEMGCHSGRWQCSAANPAPEKGLTYPNSPEQNAAKDGVRLEEPPDGRRTQSPAYSHWPASHLGLLCCLESGPDSGPLHQPLLVTPTKQSRRFQLQT